VTAQYVRYVMKSGTILEVTDLIEFNGYRFDGGTASRVPEGGRPNVHHLETASGEKYHIDQGEVAAIIFGPHSVPPLMADKPALGFSPP
jgi:hypothetical protein